MEPDSLEGVRQQKTTQRRLERLLRPRSIAIVGASATPGSLGESVLANLETWRLSGRSLFGQSEATDDSWQSVPGRNRGTAGGSRLCGACDSRVRRFLLR